MLFSTADHGHRWALQCVTAAIPAKPSLRALARGTVAAESTSGHGTHLECSRAAQGAASLYWALCKQPDSLAECRNDCVMAGCSTERILISHLSDTWTAIYKNPTNKALQAKRLPKLTNSSFSSKLIQQREQNTEFITLGPVSASIFCSCLTASILPPCSALVFLLLVLGGFVFGGGVSVFLV